MSKRQYKGTIQMPGARPQNVDLVVDKVPQITESEAAAGIAWVDGRYEPGNVLRYGTNTTPGTTDMTTALQAAIDQQNSGGAPVDLGANYFAFGTTLTIYSATAINGVNPTESILKYTGSAQAFVSDTPSTRIYDVRMRDFLLWDQGTGTIGLDLSSVSTGSFADLQIDGFTTAVKVNSPTSGYAVYNRFFNVTAANATTGFHITGTSSNATSILSCRCNSSTIGVKIDDANHVLVFDTAFDEGTTGVQITASVAGISPSNQIIHNRFEGYTTNVVIGTDVNDTVVAMNTYIDGTAFADSGTRTQRWETQGTFGNISLVNSTSSTAGPAFSLERTESAGSSVPVMKLTDSNTGAGTPNTLEVNTDRNTGRSVSVKRSSTEQLGVSPSGSIHFIEKSAADGSTAGYGQLWVKNTTPCELWFTDDAGTSTKII